MGQVVTDLEVDDEKQTPYKNMRLPYLHGNTKNSLVQQRTKWFQNKLNFSLEKADDWAADEFKALLATQDELINRDDPGQIFDRLLSLGISNSKIKFLKAETKKFFALASSGLIKQTPMKTYPKLRYSTTTRIDLLKDDERPEKMDFWTLNAGKMINIITQV